MNKKFKLEKVLELREKALEREKIKLSKLMEIDGVLQKEMNVVADDIKAHYTELESERSSGNFNFVEMYNKYIEVRKNDFLKIAKKREDLNIEIAEQKGVLNKALNDVKVMEKLKEKHLADYALFMKKQEELQIDEINITRRYENR